jgi:hypothetical protein
MLGSALSTAFYFKAQRGFFFVKDFYICWPALFMLSKL